MRQALILTLLLLGAITAWPVGQTIYVSESGSGTQSGADTNNTWSAATFNSSTSWTTSNDSGKIDPGDKVYFVGEIVTPIRARENGTVSLPTIFDIGTMGGYLNCSTSPAFTFNGKDYLVLTNFAAPIGKSISTTTDASKRGYLNFGGSLSDPAVNCVITGGAISNKTGSYFIGNQFSIGCGVTNMVFWNNNSSLINSGGAEGSAKNFFIRNNYFYGYDSGTTSQADLISIFVDDPFIDGNLFIMQLDKSGGDPHADAIQIKGNPNSIGGARSKGGTISNNFFLFRDCKDLTGGGDSFTQAFLAQYWWGDFVFSGNVLITYGHTTSGGNLVTFSRTHENNCTVKVIGNTFITLQGGHTTQLVLQPEGANNPPRTMIAEVRNNVFANFATSASSPPITETLSSSTIGSSITFGPNAFIGPNSNARAVWKTNPTNAQRTVFVQNIPVSTQEGGIRFLASDPLFISILTNSFDLRYPTNSVLLNRGEYLEAFTQFISDARMSAFPNPTLSTRPNNVDLGAWELTDGSGPTNSAPVFTAHPASAAKQVGESVTFTGAANGFPAPTYQWKKGGVSISGQTNASYTISSVALGDAGTYTVTATNSEGSATSNGAVLVVTPTPQPSPPTPGVSRRRRDR